MKDVTKEALRLAVLFIIVMCLLFWLASCSTNVKTTSAKSTETNIETVIRERQVMVNVPTIQDTLPVVRRLDSLVEAYKMRGNDTITIVRYYPYQNRVTVRVLHDSIPMVVTDTSRSELRVEKEQSASTAVVRDWWFTGKAIIGSFIIAAILAGVFWLLKKVKPL